MNDPIAAAKAALEPAGAFTSPEVVLAAYGIEVLEHQSLDLQFTIPGGRSYASNGLLFLPDPDQLTISYQISSDLDHGVALPVPDDLIPVCAAIRWVGMLEYVIDLHKRIPPLKTLSGTALFKLASRDDFAAGLLAEAYSAIAERETLKRIRRDTGSLSLRAWLNKNSIPFAVSVEPLTTVTVEPIDVPDEFVLGVYALSFGHLLSTEKGELERRLPLKHKVVSAVPEQVQLAEKGTPEAILELTRDFQLRDEDPIAWVASGPNRESRRKRALTMDPELLHPALTARAAELVGAHRPVGGVDLALWHYANREGDGTELPLEVIEGLKNHERVLLVHSPGDIQRYVTAGWRSGQVTAAQD